MPCDRHSHCISPDSVFSTMTLQKHVDAQERLFGLTRALQSENRSNVQCSFCQAIAKGIIAYYQKYIDEASKKEIKDRFSSHSCR